MKKEDLLTALNPGYVSKKINKVCCPHQPDIPGVEMNDIRQLRHRKTHLVANVTSYIVTLLLQNAYLIYPI